jgi:hypothetical protein
MTPAELQSIADNWLARATACGNNGEREQARVYLDCARAITAKAPEPPVEAAKAVAPTPAPSEAPAGVFAPGAVDRGGKPFADQD